MQLRPGQLLKLGTVNLRADFLEDGYWTPQTAMLRALQDWITASDHNVQRALSIDNNPLLDAMIRTKWPRVEIDRVIWPEVDAMNLEKTQDNFYDLVYSHQVLEHIPRPWKAAGEIVRVLRPGGLGIHTTCAFNPRHGAPHFKDYYRFLVDGLVELFEGVTVLESGEWGNREAILYNVGIDDGHGELGGRRFHESIGGRNDGRYPWHTWIVFKKNSQGTQAHD